MSRWILLLCVGSCLGSGTSDAAAEAPPAPASSPVARLSAESRARFVAALGAYRSGDWSVAARQFGDPGWAATPLGDYALLLHALSDGTFEIRDPQNGNDLVETFPSYDDAVLWLCEDEYELGDATQ